MSREAIMPEGLYDSTQLDYVHAVAAGGVLYVSGQVATDAGGDIVGETIEAQTRQVFENIALLLEEVGRGFEDVAKVRSYLTDIQADYEGFKAVYGEVFADALPAHTMLGVDSLAREEFLVEVEVEVPLT